MVYEQNLLRSFTLTHKVWIQFWSYNIGNKAIDTSRKIFKYNSTTLVLYILTSYISQKALYFIEVVIHRCFTNVLLIVRWNL